MGKMEEQVVGELAPGDLAEEEIGRGAVRAVVQRVPDLADADFAVMEIRGEPRGAADGGPFAAGGVVLHGAGQERAQVGGGAGLTRLPGLFKPGRPIDLGFQGKIGDGERVGPLRRAGNVQGRGLGRRRGGHAQAGAPEGGEDAERKPLPGAHGPGFEEEVAGTAFGGQAGGAQAAHQRTVARHQGRFVATVPIDGGGAGFGSQAAQRFRGRAAPHDEP